MTLPVAEPWLPWLHALGSDATLALGPWMPRLAAALGPVVAAFERDASGEPDGWDDLARKGSWERLLPTEWALADEVPDEFLRRAAASEQLFVRMEHRQPRKGHWCAVLCDVGPEQLGLPRMVQCALIAALCWRRGAQGRVVVGALQGDELWEPALDRATGRGLFRARSRLAPTREDLSRWSARLAAEAQEAEPPELWILGGEQAVRLAPPGASRVRIGERLAGGDVEPELDVMRARGAPQRLVLPAVPPLTGLLSDPFAQQRPTRPTGGPATIRYGRSRHLLVRAGARVELWSTPRRSHRVRVLDESDIDGTLVGAGRVKQRLATLRRLEDELVYETRFGTWALPCPAPLRTPTGDGPIGPLWGTRTSAVIVDGAGVVWALDFEERDATPLGRTQDAVVFGNNGIQWLEAGGIRRSEGAQPVWIEPGPPVEALAPCPGRARIAARRGGQWLGFEPGDHGWKKMPDEPLPTSGAPPIGLTPGGTWVSWEEDCVVLRLRDGSMQQTALPERAAEVCLDPEGEVLAVLSADRATVWFQDLYTGAVWSTRELG